MRRSIRSKSGFTIIEFTVTIFLFSSVIIGASFFFSGMMKAIGSQFVMNSGDEMEVNRLTTALIRDINNCSAAYAFEGLIEASSDGGATYSGVYA